MTPPVPRWGGKRDARFRPDASAPVVARRAPVLDDLRSPRLRVGRRSLTPRGSRDRVVIAGTSLSWGRARERRPRGTTTLLAGVMRPQDNPERAKTAPALEKTSVSSFRRGD